MMNDQMMALNKKRMEGHGSPMGEKPLGDQVPEAVKEPEQAPGMAAINAKLDIIIKHLGIDEVGSEDEGTQEA